MHGGVVGCVRLQLKVSRQVELDFMSRLGVYRKRPRTWGNGQRHPCYPDKVGGCERRRREATRVDRDCAGQHKRVHFTLSAGAHLKPDGQNREDRAPKVVGACNAVSPTKSKPSRSCRSSSFGGALRITRRPSQLESEPCEAGRNNPSRRHASTRLKTEEARLEPLSVGRSSASGDQSRDATCPTPPQDR